MIRGEPWRQNRRLLGLADLADVQGDTIAADDLRRRRPTAHLTCSAVAG
jgi:hypothetical protein